MEKSIKKLMLMMSALCFFTMAQAQNATIVGKVIDEIGETLPGVNVVIKGQAKGTVTNIDGVYSVVVENPKNATLVFSYIGMSTLEEKVGNKRTINVTLKSNSVLLNEFVAVGYGTMQRKDLTGSVTSVNAAEIAKVPVSNVAQALAGRMSGVSVSQSEGDINNSSISIRVRGGISLTQDNEPLYVIDGFPTDASVFQALNPNDVESIDVLKDASSTAIYGARGANGVVVVTTKGGVEGKTSVTYEGYVGVKTISKSIETLSMPEYAYLQYERTYKAKPDGTPDMGSYTDRYGEFANIGRDYTNRPGVNWEDESFREAFTQNHKISISGGTKDLKYNLSYGRQDEQGLMIESGLKKDNIRFKMDHKINKRARVNASINFTAQKSFGMGTSDGGTNFSKMSSIIMYLPTLGHLITDEKLASIANLNDYDAAILDDNGNTMQNPAASARAELNNKELRIFNASAGFSYELLKGLTFKNSTGMLYRTARNEVYNGRNSIIGLRQSISGSIQNLDRGQVQTSNTLSYDFRKRSHKFSILLGQEYIAEWNRWFRTSVTNLPNDDMQLNDLSLGLPSPSESNFNDDDKMLSFFARGYYNYKDKYMLTATARYDGSSKFGKNNKWGFFPSASFAWRASEEEFIKQLGVFSDLKLRIGYGSAGNNRIPAYSSLALWGSQLTPEGNGSVPGYYPIQMANDNLRWEANNTFNTGLDIGFFDQRLSISPEFYINRSYDLLLNSTIPSSSGHSNMIQNIGRTENMGVDLTITSINIQKKDFTWTTTLTLSHNKNKILALAGEQSFLEDANFGYKMNNYKVEVGKPIGQIYGFKTLGLYQVDDFQLDAGGQLIPITNGDKVMGYKLKPGVPYDSNNLPKPGHWKYENIDGNTLVDAEGNPLISEADRQVIGSAQPVIYGGLNNTFSYKGFDLSIFMNYNVGNDVLNATRLFGSLYGWSNKNTFAYADSNNRWVTIGADGRPITDAQTMQRVNQGKTTAQWGDMENGDMQVHSWGVEDGSFLRISNVTLGYTIPKELTRKIKVENLRFYVSGNNLYCFSNYSGYDPEVSTRNPKGLTPGVDWSSFPRNRSFVFGLSLGF